MKFSLYFFSADGDRTDPSKYEFLLHTSRFADRNGFEAIWTPERHFRPFGGLFPNPCILAGALAATTTRIGIRAGSLVLPLHGAVRTAENWALVDNLSGGRVGVSLASGWHPDDYVIASDKYHRRKEILYQEIETVRRLWAGETLELTGVDGQTCAIRTLPRPVQPQLPIWITANSPTSWIKAADIGANIFTSIMGSTTEHLATNIKKYRQRVAQGGSDPRKKIVTVMVHTYVGESDSEAHRLCTEPLRAYFRAYLEQFGDSEKGAAKESQNMEAVLDYSVERYFKGSALIGTQASCQRIAEELRTIGVNELACLIDFGVDLRKVETSLDKLVDLKNVFDL